MIAIPILIVASCTWWFCLSTYRQCCYKDSERRLGGNGCESDDSVEEVDMGVDIQLDDGTHGVQRGSGTIRKFFRRQFNFVFINCLCGVFYMAASGFSLFSLAANNYDVQAAKPLDIPA